MVETVQSSTHWGNRALSSGGGGASTPKNSNCRANYYRKGPTGVSKSTLNGEKRSQIPPYNTI